VHVVEPSSYASNIGNAAKFISDTHYRTDDSQFNKERDGVFVGQRQVEKALMQ
jgi:hypothetical protein